MNATATHEGTFVGLSRNAVDQVIGPAAAIALVRIDHDELQYGCDWRWVGGQQVFTEEGLDVLARQLDQRGFVGAARLLEIEVRRRRERAIVANRWDLRAEFA